MKRYVTQFAYNNLKTGYLYHINAMNNIIAIAKTDISKHIFIDQKAYWQEKLRQLDEMIIVENSNEWLEKTNGEYNHDIKSN